VTIAVEEGSFHYSDSDVSSTDFDGWAVGVRIQYSQKVVSLKRTLLSSVHTSGRGLRRALEEEQIM
jgi:hypothetical protein